MTISYAITAWNEHEELDRLLTQLEECKRHEDEIVIQVDTTATKEVKHVISKHNLILHEYPLNGDFASFKNNIKSLANGDYCVMLDADEYLGPGLAEHLPSILDMNPQIDIYMIPRINTVSGLTDADIRKWGWRVNEKGWVNYPDLQTRICKNVPQIKWKGSVHERLMGEEEHITAILPEGFEIIHPKNIDRQRQQNDFYDKF